MMKELGTKARAAARLAAAMPTEEKNALLACIAQQLQARREEIFAANDEDMRAGQENGLTESLLDRLKLNQARLDGMCEGVEQVIALPDPIGELLDQFTLSSGARARKIRVPMGVIGIIYESRPNVTVDAAVLCLKAGSAVILRGGKEAIHSNRKLVEIMRAAIEQAGGDANLVALVQDTSRASAQAMMHAKGVLDLLIPRGGAGLIQAIVREATVPIIETGAGICHCYVDNAAKLDMAVEIAYNAKTSRPSVCNAIETVLVHRDVAEAFLPLMAQKMAEKQVVLHGCEETCRILGASVIPVADGDYDTEYGDFILNCRVVSDVAEAIAHINAHGTMHSECIVTENAAHAALFLQDVDAAAVYHNVSTRFTDGFEFGLGAEIGISTQKTHARGPMGLREICSYKYLIEGEGQIR